MSDCTGLSSRLLKNLTSESPMEAILKTGASVLGHALYFIDCTGKILAYALPPVLSSDQKGKRNTDMKNCCKKAGILPDHVWQSFCSRGCVDLNTCRIIFPQADQRSVTGSRTDSIMISGCTIREDLFTSCTLSADRRIFACLVVHTAFDMLKNAELDNLNTLCRTLILLLHQAAWPYCKSPKELLLTDLLENQPSSRLTVTERCRITGLKSNADFLLMTICNSQNITDKPVFDVAVQKLHGILPDFIYIIHNNRLVILFDGILLDKARAASGGLTDFLKKYRLTAAVSFPFEHIYDTHQAYIQTLQALDEGLAIDDSDNLYLYQDYLPYHALSYVKSQKDFCHPCIVKLMTEDARHKTEYTKTLYYYIINFRNQKNAAQEMNIHYNTMKYRLKKIQSFIDFSLEDNDEFLLLYLSFKLMKLNGHIF